MQKSTLIALTLAASMLSACANNGPGSNWTNGGGITKQQVGTVAGAVGGGVLGSTMGRGAGKTAATIGGALIGGALGNSVGQSLDNGDRAVRDQQNY